MHCIIGKINHQKGRYRKALESFDKVLELHGIMKFKPEISHDELNEYAEASVALKKILMWIMRWFSMIEV